MLAMSVLTLVLTSGGVQRDVIVKNPSKNTSLDVLNLDEGSIPFTRSTHYQALTTDCSKSAVK